MEEGNVNTHATTTGTNAPTTDEAGDTTMQ